MLRTLLPTLALSAAMGCTGSPSSAPVTPPTPTPAPASQPAAAAPQPPAQADPTVRASAFADMASARAMAEGTTEDVVNELSGETVGVNITRSAAGPFAGIPCDATIGFYEETWGCELTESWNDGHRVTGKGNWVPFHYSTGHRAGFVLSALEPVIEKLDVGGVPCTEFVHFHPDGALSGCVLASAHTVGKTALPKQSQVELRADGSLEMAVVFEPITVDGNPIPAGMVHFGPDGSVTMVAEDFYGE